MTEKDTGKKEDRQVFLCHDRSIEETFEKFNSSDQGLDNEEAEKRLLEYGKNALPEKKPVSIWTIILNQFKSPLIYILIAAGAVSLVLKDYKDAVFIFIVILLNSGLGAYQESKAEKSADYLQKLIKITVKAVRNGSIVKIDSEELVPGDIVILESGGKVPADIRLFETVNLTINESILTGESVAADKNIRKVEEKTLMSECSNIAFAGTQIATGKAKGMVTRTGTNTEIGSIAKSVYSSKAEKTPLLVRMEKFSKQVGLIVIGVSLLLAIIAFTKNMPYYDIFLMAIALAVSAIPEGLPVAVTVALSISTSRMAKRNVIVRKLSAVESLGSCTMIASDKTGTLTLNRQTAKILITADSKRYFDEDLKIKKKYFKSKKSDNNSDVEELIKAMIIDNDASLNIKDGKLEIIGNPIDSALLKLGNDLNIDHKKIRNDILKKAEIPFNSEYKFSAKAFKKETSYSIAVKGAPEVLIKKCSKMLINGKTKKIDREVIEKQVEDLTKEGYRVIAAAFKDYKNESMLDEVNHLNIENLTFLGIVGFIDPLRPDVSYAVRKAKNAGITVIMITGDHPATALNIAKELGIAESEDDIINGSKIDEILTNDEEGFADSVKDKKVFARVTPDHKLKIVEAFKKMGHFVAVTGDGVNDAPALRTANIGVAMGSGTDVTKDTASIIITDDSFSSIVSGVEEGRYAYDNIRKVTYLLIATGVAEIILFSFSLISGLPIALLAVQILWLNLVTNGIQDIALAFEKGEGAALLRKPRDPKEGIFNKLMIEQTVISGITMGASAGGIYFYLIKNGWDVGNARNMILMLMVLFENIHVFNCRSETASAFRVPIRNNYILIGGVIAAQLIHVVSMYIPFMQRLLGISPISIIHWLVLLFAASSVILVMELFKIINRKNQNL